jgi:hypothetical protein
VNKKRKEITIWFNTWLSWELIYGRNRQHKWNNKESHIDFVVKWKF